MKFFQQYKLVARAWRYRLIIDRGEIQYLIHNIKKNDRCIDISANKGACCYWMSKFVGEKVKVYAFDPQPQLFKSFQGAITSSKISNIQLSQPGFSNTILVNSLIVPNGLVFPSASFQMKKTDKDAALKSIDNYDFFEFQIDPKQSTYINNFVFEPK